MRLFQRISLILVTAIIAASFASPASGQTRSPASAEPPKMLYLPLITIPAHLYLPLISQAPAVRLTTYNGSIVAIVADPAKSAILYAGSWGNGVFKSSDGGATWYPSNQGIPNGYINSLAIDLARPSILYAGTYGDGVYKSTDGGASWSGANAGIQSGAVVYSMAVNSGQADIVYAGTRSLSVPANGPWKGIFYRSTNGGASWSAVPTLQDLGGTSVQDWIYSIAVDPVSPKTVYAASHLNGPWRSTDSGATWVSVMNSGIEKSGRAVITDPRPDHSGTLYYAVWYNQLGVYKSTNRGDTWSRVVNGLPGIKIYPDALTLATSTPDTLYVGDMREAPAAPQGIFKSTDAAVSWHSTGLQGMNIYAVVASPADGNTVFVGAQDHGIYRSSDGGHTWTEGQFALTAQMQASGVVVDPFMGH